MRIPILCRLALLLLPCFTSALALSEGTGGEAKATDTDAESHWAQWRGPGGRGVVPAQSIPTVWDASTLLWRTEIEGRGHSAPVIWGGQLFLTTAVEGEVIEGAEAPVHLLGGQEFVHPDSVGADRRHTFKVLAFEVATGKRLWERTAYEGRVYDNRHRASSYASPTPVTDGKRVYAYFGSQGVFAYDFSGQKVWERDIGDIKTVGMGVGTSPVLYQDLLIIQADEDAGDNSFLVALHRLTGEEVWRVGRSVQASWTTPLLTEDGSGSPQLVTSGNELVIAYDPLTGREIWRAKGLESNAIHTPLPVPGMVIFTAGYPRKITMAMRLDPEGDSTANRQPVWSYNKGTAYVPSNLTHEGYLYLTNDSGTLTCLRAETGEVVYEGGRSPAGGNLVASPIVVGDQILLIHRDGDAVFVRAGPNHEVVSTTSLGEPVYATPAVAGGRLFVRGERHLWAIGHRKAD